jgi:hypothetical protein
LENLKGNDINNAGESICAKAYYVCFLINGDTVDLTTLSIYKVKNKKKMVKLSL